MATPDLKDSQPTSGTDQPATAGRIVVGVDGSAHSAYALKWALRQAVLTGAAVEAVACWEWPASAGAFGPYADFDMSTVTKTLAHDAVEAAVAATPGSASVPVAIRVDEGYPARLLLEASADADLLVVGSRGHGALSGLLLGSVGLHCASHSVCPVVIVHDDPAPPIDA